MTFAASADFEPAPNAGIEAEACARAEAFFTAQGLRLSPIRRHVLAALHASAEPLSAYTMLRNVEPLLQRRVSPPTIYRTLEWLVQHRLAARLARRNAYVARQEPGRGAALFYICTSCNRTAEIEDPDVLHSLRDEAQQIGFAMTGLSIEIEGACRACQQTVAFI